MIAYSRKTGRNYWKRKEKSYNGNIKIYSNGDMMNGIYDNSYETMNKIIIYIIMFFIGVITTILIILLSGTIDKIDKIYSILDTDRVNTELEVDCNK